MRTDYYYPSGGIGVIHGCRWTPDGDIRAVVQIVHGIGEYVERYDDFAKALTQQGILVIAEDHMGHGKSIGGDGVQGYFAGGWFTAVDDSYRLLAETRKEFPNVPYFLFGHSMGSFMARTLLCRYPDCGITAAIISGTGWQGNGVVHLGKWLSGMVCKLSDERKPNVLLQTLCFGTYNARIHYPKTKYDWLTRDEQVVAAYTADPLCGYTMASAALLRDMMTGIIYNQAVKNLGRMKKDLPVLFIAGEEDPVGSYGKAVRHTANAFRKAGMEAVSVKLYPHCRHELHNELNRQEVYADIINWLGNYM